MEVRWHKMAFGPLDIFDLILRSPVVRSPVVCPACVVRYRAERTDDGFVYRVDLPGYTADEVKVSLDPANDGIRIRAVQQVEEGQPKTRRDLSLIAGLPDGVDESGLKAALREGVLTLTIPWQAEEAQESREITVER